MEQKKCQFCEKKIEGFTKKQVDHLLLQHILAKHSEKVTIG